MWLEIKRKMAPPVFPDDEIKTRQASLLNLVLLMMIAMVVALCFANAFSRMAPALIVIDVIVVLVCLVLSLGVRRGYIQLAGIVSIVMGMVLVTLGSATLGTIRTPTSAIYLALILVAGMLFDLRGVVVSTVASSLAVAGLIGAENAGWLPPPDYAVTVTQWITYTALFGLAGGLSVLGLKPTRDALARADREIAERKRIEQELRQLSRVVEQSPVTIVITNLAGEIEYANPRFTETTGYAFDQAVGKNPRLLKSGHTTQLEYKQLWDTITAGGTWRGEFRNKKKNGDLYWEAATITPIWNERGEITHFLAVKEDITERKHAEDDLRESEARFRTIFYQDQAIKLLIDPETGAIVDANPAAVNFYGYSHEQLTQLKIQAINQLTPAQVHAEMQRARAQAKNYFNFRHKLASGEIRDVEVYSTTLTLNRHEYLFSLVHDVTQQRQAERALHESEEKFRQFFEQSNDGIALLDESGNVIEWNAALEQLTGLERAQTLGKPIVEIQTALMPVPPTPEIVEHQKKLMATALKTGQSPFLLVSSSFRKINAIMLGMFANKN